MSHFVLLLKSNTGKNLILLRICCGRIYLYATISTIPIMLWWSWYYTNPKDEASFYYCFSKVSFCHTAILSSSHPVVLPFWHLFFYLVILSFHSKCTLPIFSCKTYTTNRAVELHFPDLQTGYSLLQPFLIGIQFQVQGIYIQVTKSFLKENKCM